MVEMNLGEWKRWAGRLKSETSIRKAKEIGFDSYDIFEDPLDITPAEQAAIKFLAAGLAGDPELRARFNREVKLYWTKLVPRTATPAQRRLFDLVDNVVRRHPVKHFLECLVASICPIDAERTRVLEMNSTEL